MADEKTLKVKNLILRNDTKENWDEKNPVLLRGELGIEIDTRKFKFGDGVKAWKELDYASGGNVVVAVGSPKATDIAYDVGTIWVDVENINVFILFAATETAAAWIELPTTNGEVESAKKLSTARTFTFDGDIVATSKTFDGSGDVSFNIVLKNSGVTEGTYTKIKVNEKGIITETETLTAADIPELTLSKISDAGTAASKDIGTSAGNVPVLDANGKLNDSVLPDLALTDTHTVDSEEEMLALPAQKGDVAIRTDENKSYILSTNEPSELASWKVLKTPDCKVLSVNGKTGAITLTTDDIEEGSENLYFTTQRVDDRIAETSVKSLSDGEDVVLKTDTIIIDGGNA